MLDLKATTLLFVGLLQFIGKDVWYFLTFCML